MLSTFAKQVQLGAGAVRKVFVGAKERLEKVRHLPQAQLEEVVVELLLGGRVHAADADQKAGLGLCVRDRADQPQHHVVIGGAVTGLDLNADAVLAQP